MIELRLQMFGGGSSGGGGAGGGGTNASKSSSKQAVSSNAPGSGHGGGGRRMDGGGPKQREEEQARTTRNKPTESKPNEPKKSTDNNAPVKRIVPTERYTIHSRRGDLQESSISGNDMIKAGYRYDQRDEVWRDKQGKEVKVRIARRK